MPSPRNSTRPGTRMRPARSDAASAAVSRAPAIRMSWPAGMRAVDSPGCERVAASMAGAHPDTTAAILAALAVAAFAARAVSLLWGDFLPPRPPPKGDAGGDYRANPYRFFYRVTVISLGAGALLLLIALAHGTGVSEGGLIWLGAYGVTRIAIAFFPTDLGGETVTTTGQIHLLLAAIAFTAIAFAAADLTPALRDEPGWGATRLLDVLHWAVIVTAIGTGVTRVVLPLRRVFGLVERLLYAATIAFLLVVAVEAVRVLS